MTNWSNYRDLFPVVKNYSYFMTAGAGAIPTSVIEAIKNCYENLSLHGGQAFQGNFEVMESCRQGIADLINADPDHIAFIPNVSYGMNALANSLADKRHYLVPKEEFPSSTLPWENSGHKITFVSSDDDLQTNLINVIKDNSDSSVITSIVQYATGHRLDLDHIRHAMVSPNADFIVNATQGIGVFPMDVKKTKIDALIGSCYKWMFCGEGISFMYIHPDFFKKLAPTLVGWRSTPHVWQMANTSPQYYESAKIFELGWSNMAIFAGLRKSLDILNEIGVSKIADRVLYLMDYLIKGIKLRDIPVLSNLSSQRNSGIILLGPFDHLDDILKELQDHNVLVTKRGNGIRLSLHFYNNEEDIDQFLRVMDHIMKEPK